MSSFRISNRTDVAQRSRTGSAHRLAVLGINPKRWTMGRLGVSGEQSGWPGCRGALRRLGASTCFQPLQTCCSVRISGSAVPWTLPASPSMLGPLSVLPAQLRRKSRGPWLSEPGRGRGCRSHGGPWLSGQAGLRQTGALGSGTGAHDGVEQTQSDGE